MRLFAPCRQVSRWLAACATAILAGAPPAVLQAGEPIQAPPAGVPTSRDALVEQPRPFGHVLGDVLTQRVLLQVDGRQFEPAILPPAERIGVWFDRRAPRIETGADGRRWLVIEYQLVNAPQFLARLHLPAWELKDAAGATVLKIEDWTFSAAPLTPRMAFVQGGLDELRPDRSAPLVETGAIRRQLGLWSGMLAALLLTWVAATVWRNRRASARQPFARALRAVRGSGDTSPEAWQAVHRAFDASAGLAVQSATLPLLFERAPHLAPMRTEIERFFAQSAARFYGTASVAEPVPVRALCAALRRLEKRHER